MTLHIHEEHSSEKIPPVELPLDIIYEDEDLMVINKPAGMPIHPSMNNYYNSLANGLAYYFAQQNCPFVFRCINRLDRDTSGLTIIAKHYVSAGMLSTMIANKTSSSITREYLAIVKALCCLLRVRSPLLWDVKKVLSLNAVWILKKGNPLLPITGFWTKKTGTAWSLSF